MQAAAPRPRAGAVFGAYVVFVVLIGATIPWRSKTYFEGGADPVVLAKAALSMAGLGLAVLLTAARPARALAAAPTVFLSLYLVVTVLGGWSDGSLLPSLVIAVRVALLAATVTVLARCFSAVTLLGCLIAALATFAVAGSLTGIPSLGAGRLRGGLPPLHPNELASICVLSILWCLWKVVAGLDRWLHLGALVFAMLVLLATGSRTPLFALFLGAVVLLLHTTALRRRTIGLTLAGAPVLLWIFLGTGLVTDILLRDDGTAGLTTLSNRTIAWQAALAPKATPWLEWLGGGLTMKRVEVPGQFWNQQILDSSWISAYVQGGIVGFAVCALWLLYSVIATTRSHRRLRALQLAILVYLAARGFLESGLFDASTAFLMFFLVVSCTPLNPAWRGEGSAVPARLNTATVTDAVTARDHQLPIV